MNYSDLLFLFSILLLTGIFIPVSFLSILSVNIYEMQELKTLASLEIEIIYYKQNFKKHLFSIVEKKTNSLFS